MKKLATLFLLLWIIASESLAQTTFQNAYTNLTFPFPVEMVAAPDGTNRMFVVSQNGLIHVFPNNSGVTTAQRKYLINLGRTSQNGIPNGLDSIGFVGGGDERGLLGLAFHPNFTSNRYFYVYYTRPGTTNLRMVLARYRVSASNPDTVEAGSGTIMFQFEKNQGDSNHNGGKIAFGPDGFIYLSIGDGGGGNDPQNNAQNTNSLFGKILRIDIDNDDFPADPNANYRIPSDNPFASGGGGRAEIYALGIRNMWKFSFDNVNGRLWGGDVGQGSREEINLITRGGNYGWDICEGTCGSFLQPIFTYPRSDGRSITGGYVYRGTVLPNLFGKYIYGDFVTGNVWALSYDGTTATNEFLFNATGIGVSSFGVDQQGEHYFCGYGATGRIYRIINGTAPPAGQTVNGIGSWAAMNGGVNGIVRAVAVDASGNVYVGGSFTTAGGISANNIARWNPSSGWSALGNGTSGAVNSIAASGGDIFVGGSFATAGGVTANNIARWNGSSWSALGSGTSDAVAAIAVNGAEVYVGGVFLSAGGVSGTTYIARWNITNGWRALSGTLNNEVRSLAVNPSTGDVFAGGNFTTDGTTTLNRIGRWNGSWSALAEGADIGTDGFVYAIAVDNATGTVFAGGSFTRAGSVTTANRIARWNGSTWSALGGGVTSIVNALALGANGDLFVGGFHTVSDGALVNYVSRWNSASGWTALGQGAAVGADAGINALALNGQTLFVGGNQLNAGGSTVNYIARCALPTAGATMSVGAGDSQMAFAGTSVNVNFTGVASAGSVTVQRYDDAPQNPVGVVGNVSPYRFVIDQIGLGSFNATLRFNRTQIPNNGIFNPQTVRVYRRPTPGSGTFSLLSNAFDSGNPDEVRATTNAFSEFVFGGDGDNPLPVELSTFTGNATTNGVSLRWTTQSERNNAGFVLMRSTSSRAEPATPFVEIASYRFDQSLKGKGTTASATTYGFLDGGVETGKTYAYKLRSFDLDGAAHDYAQTVSVEVREPVQARVYDYALMQNYPNPFNPTTVIRFTMKAAGAATISVYDMLGRAVARQVLNATTGENQYRFDASGLGSGAYFYTLQAGGLTQTRKMMLVK